MASDRIPLRPDVRAAHHVATRSFNRACVALVKSALNRGGEGYATDVLRREWRDDDAERVLKAVSSPTDTSAFWQASPSVILPALAPAAAATRLMQAGKALSLAGVNTVRIPYIGASGRPQEPWVAEGAPGPVVQLVTSSLTLGPTHKFLIFTSLTEELQLASAATAEAVISETLSIAVAQSLDGALFSTAAGTSSSPPGILNGLTAIVSGGGTGAAGLAADIAKLAAAIASAGINAETMILITDAASAAKIKILASPKFDNEVWTSVNIPAGEVIAVVPEGFYTAYGASQVTVEISKQSTLHFDSTAPLPVVQGVPTRSLYQQGFLGLKARALATWLVHPGAVAYLTGAAW
jgi:hypothetical protein